MVPLLPRVLYVDYDIRRLRRNPALGENTGRHAHVCAITLTLCGEDDMSVLGQKCRSTFMCAGLGSFHRRRRGRS